MEVNKGLDKSEGSKAPEPVKSKRKISKNILWVVIAIILFGGLVGFGVWRDMGAKKDADKDKESISALQKQVNDLQKKLEESEKKNSASAATPTASCTQPTASAVENIIASIKSKNTAALEGYMASNVKVTLAATEFSEVRTKAQAVSNVDYVINATAPWDFALSTATLNTFKAGSYKDYIKDNSVIGVAADSKTIVFNFDCDGKINAIFMSASSDLLTE